ncbi:hypothetical protein A4X13_0g6222 [Tilletia indica]|uniref:Ribosomal protein S18 n=1 Tax=Tilletia indica TaxID=43049 RepID=A0A177TWN7_9BASI|nr:hypothetical protein A4X13_0g6222 [Tilletia indica]
MSALARTLLARSVAAAASASTTSTTLARHTPRPSQLHHSFRWASSSASAPTPGSSSSENAEQQSNQAQDNAVGSEQEPLYAAEAAASSSGGSQQSAEPTRTKEASLEDILGQALAPSLSPDSPQEPTATPRPRQDPPSPSSSFSSRPAAYAPLTPTHRLHIMTTRNNTILTFTTPQGDPLASASGGTAGFKKSQRSGYEAGYRAAFQMFGHIAEYRRSLGYGVGAPVDSAAARTFGGLVTAPIRTGGEEDLRIETIWNGFGQGREAVFRALMTNEGQEIRNLVKRVTDGTPLKIGGVRPKKRRML